MMFDGSDRTLLGFLITAHGSLIFKVNPPKELIDNAELSSTSSVGTGLSSGLTKIREPRTPDMLFTIM